VTRARLTHLRAPKRTPEAIAIDRVLDATVAWLDAVEERKVLCPQPETNRLHAAVRARQKLRKRG
jgi:hypothetical protein